jgi:hypothetical protein
VVGTKVGMLVTALQWSVHAQLNPILEEHRAAYAS